MKLTINKSATEDTIIEGCRKRNSLCQKELYEKFSDKMYGVCLRYVKDRDTAQDILVQGFLKVFDKISQFKNEGSFEGWIRRIMVNESLSYLRKNKSMYMEVELEYAEREPDFQALENTLEAEELMEMISVLPVGYRTVFNLYAIEGYSHKEIGEMLGINENTSKSQLSRARKHLQQMLAKHEMNLNMKLSIP